MVPNIGLYSPIWAKIHFRLKILAVCWMYVVQMKQDCEPEALKISNRSRSWYKRPSSFHIFYGIGHILEDGLLALCSGLLNLAKARSHRASENVCLNARPALFFCKTPHVFHGFECLILWIEIEKDSFDFVGKSGQLHEKNWKLWKLQEGFRKGKAYLYSIGNRYENVIHSIAHEMQCPRTSLHKLYADV